MVINRDSWLVKVHRVWDCRVLLSLKWDIYIPTLLPKAQVSSWKWEQKYYIIARGSGRLVRNVVFQVWQGHYTHELMVVITRPAQDQARQKSRMDGGGMLKPTLAEELLAEESVFFRDESPDRLLTFQCVAPLPCRYWQHWVGSGGLKTSTWSWKEKLWPAGGVSAGVWVGLIKTLYIRVWSPQSFLKGNIKKRLIQSTTIHKVVITTNPSNIKKIMREYEQFYARNTC